MYREKPVELAAWNPGGDLGSLRTLGLMSRYVRRAQRDPALHELAARVLQEGAPEGPREAVQVVRSWLDGVWRFQDDPPEAELLKTPRRMLRELSQNGIVRGDCDDAAILGAALGMALGFPARFVVIGFERGGPFRHVYAELQTPAGWEELDVTRPDQKWVEDVPIFRRWARKV